MHSSDEALTPSIQVIGRMFALLEALAASDHPAALKVLSERTGLHPSTAHRILNDLAQGGFVERPSSGHYRLGVRLVELGNVVKGKLDLRFEALAPLRELHRIAKLPVALHVRQDDRLHTYPLTPVGRGSTETLSPAALPPAWLHESELGLLLLGHLSANALQLYQLRAMAQATSHEEQSRVQALPQRIGQMDKRRLSSIHNGHGSSMLAALVFDDQEQPIAAVTLAMDGAPTREDPSGELRRAADRITRAMGGHPPN